MNDAPKPLVLERRLFIIFVLLFVRAIVVAVLSFFVRTGVVVTCMSVMVMEARDIMAIPIRMSDRLDRPYAAGIVVVVHVTHRVRALSNSVLLLFVEPIAVAIGVGL